MNRIEAKNWIEKTCGKGWLALVDKVFDELPTSLSITQAYQKWAALKFDIKPYDETFQDFLEEIEETSLKTCEICGAEGHCYIIEKWERTRCVSHAQGGVRFE